MLPALLAIAIHLPALWADLFLDDRPVIVEHPRIADAGFIKEIFARDYGQELGVQQEVGYYRPLLMVINYGLYRLFGPSPFGYHTTVLLLFALSCSLLTAVAMRALGDGRRLLALTMGCLAAVHPIRTEFAVFFTTMPDLLMEIYGLLIIGICLERAKKLPQSVRLAALALLALSAGVTKETSFFIVSSMGATLCFVGLFNHDARRRILEGLSLFLGLGSAMILRFGLGVSLPAGAGNGVIFRTGSSSALDGAW